MKRASSPQGSASNSRIAIRPIVMRARSELVGVRPAFVQSCIARNCDAMEPCAHRELAALRRCAQASVHASTSKNSARVRMYQAATDGDHSSSLKGKGYSRVSGVARLRVLISTRSLIGSPSSSELRMYWSACAFQEWSSSSIVRWPDLRAW